MQPIDSYLLRLKAKTPDTVEEAWSLYVELCNPEMEGRQESHRAFITGMFTYIQMANRNRGDMQATFKRLQDMNTEIAKMALWYVSEEERRKYDKEPPKHEFV